MLRDNRTGAALRCWRRASSMAHGRHDAARLKYMSVDHGGFYIFVAEQLLDDANIIATL
jgi:hypothetical protein